MTLLVPSDLYNCWFSVPVSTPHIEVDYETMNALMQKLPQGYAIPDPVSMVIMNEKD
ncbi:hypothetical protein PAECIP112173_03768 [Paenibacillus sp. JJ-100]|uniref:hypothetical protein n=1 Tax=Paenibacillus sp. JJ-100 TaxID=2974896 RepID=UPI0022FFBF15|nr:hypothetical protein [Paenibacillus sp. JJ-100]CAI6083037.1 hypothetical protein PAECIP112173_03768 [Paenibacillus sp. JJ-100]